MINHRTAESDEEVSREEQAPIAHEESEDEDYAQSEGDSEESEDVSCINQRKVRTMGQLA